MIQRRNVRLLFAAAAAASIGLGIERVEGGTLYWDIDGSTPGASGSTTAGGTWDASATTWSTSADGDVATGAWASGEIAAFSAGNDATGVATTITLSGIHTISGLDFQEGQVNLSGTGAGNGLALTGTPNF